MFYNEIYVLVFFYYSYSVLVIKIFNIEFGGVYIFFGLSNYLNLVNF